MKPDTNITDDSPTLVHAPTRPTRDPASAVHERLWDAADVARYLKVSRSWVYHRAESGMLPCVRVGALLRFSPAAVRRHVEGK